MQKDTEGLWCEETKRKSGVIFGETEETTWERKKDWRCSTLHSEESESDEVGVSLSETRVSEWTLNFMAEGLNVEVGLKVFKGLKGI